MSKEKSAKVETVSKESRENEMDHHMILKAGLGWATEATGRSALPVVFCFLFFFQEGTDVETTVFYISYVAARGAGNRK